MKRLNRGEVMQIWRLGDWTDCENFVSIYMWSVIWPGKSALLEILRT